MVYNVSLTFSRGIKFMKSFFIILFWGLIINSQAMAKIYTGIEFTDAEKKLHLSQIDVITTEAGKCLNDTYLEQTQFMKNYGVTKFYGNRRYIKGWDYKVENGRRLTPIKLVLKDNKKDPNLEDQMENMSCVDFARKCLHAGFKKANLEDQWLKIDAYNPDKIGNLLQHGLQALGWKILYWNPNPSMNSAWDLDDQQIAPGNPLNVWGHNEVRYNSVIRNQAYLYNYVDDYRTLVNFGTEQPRILESIKFAVGTANTGYHVFPVTKGQVIEAHSTRSLFATDNLEFSPFNPLATGGGPRWTPKEKYRSGLLVVPPNYLD